MAQKPVCILGFMLFGSRLLSSNHRNNRPGSSVTSQLVACHYSTLVSLLRAAPIRSGTRTAFAYPQSNAHFFLFFFLSFLLQPGWLNLADVAALIPGERGGGRRGEHNDRVYFILPCHCWRPPSSHQFPADSYSMRPCH
ncbi:hypothetical protein IF1G_07115 [Cordyceps javanica]|uniref:Uncharacterized protein n=1 Tax=Cordyceps javanica TaxID=43265 RepID=A0A545UXR6_9HYPO|nr:hypothetical protein IF1G_07115 [Cordyceps javanica]